MDLPTARMVGGMTVGCCRDGRLSRMRGEVMRKT
jgi:hypothetical protein